MRQRPASATFGKAQSRFDGLSDWYAQALECGTPFAQHRELETAETALESSTAEVDAIALSLQAAYALTEQSVRINNLAADQSGARVALVAAGGTGEIEAVLMQSHEFEQLHRLCTSATFFDGLRIEWQRPNLERARLFDRMLHASGHEPGFSLFDDEDALGAANEMGKFLYARLGPRTVRDLADGRTTLRALGLDKAFASQLKSMVPKSLCTRRTLLLEDDA